MTFNFRIKSLAILVLIPVGLFAQTGGKQKSDLPLDPAVRTGKLLLIQIIQPPEGIYYWGR